MHLDLAETIFMHLDLAGTIFMHLDLAGTIVDLSFCLCI